jgi:RPA family protein
VNVSVRPESITVVDASTRDRWVVETAQRTLDRLDAFDEESNEYARMAKEQYDLPVDQYKQATLAALESLDESDELEAEAEANA